MKKVGLLIIATNNYTSFLSDLIQGADKWFLTDQDVTYFIFTNKDIDNIKSQRKIVKVDTEHKPWPWMTLGRYSIFSNNAQSLSGMDYLYYCDADMRFVDAVGTEILGDRVATQHPCLYGTRGTPETNPKSLACVYPHEPMQYFAGGFNGGSSEEFLKMSSVLADNIAKDYSNDIIAVWHDESHLNRYFIDNKPTNILTPSYCYAEGWYAPFPAKLLALVKNHNIRH